MALNNYMVHYTFQNPLLGVSIGLFRSSTPIKKLADVLNSPSEKNDWI